MQALGSTLESITETVKSYGGLNYVVYVAKFNTNTKTSYRCNCSEFYTEIEVVNFINEITEK